MWNDSAVLRDWESKWLDPDWNYYSEEEYEEEEEEEEEEDEDAI